MTGKIIKGIAGFYYVHVPNKGIYECKARGLLRKQNIKPLIGDNVTIDILENQDFKGNIIDIMQRKNQLIRPTVANIEQVMIVFSVSSPKPNLNLLDRFIILIEKENIPISICFNKIDTLPFEEIEKMKNIYENIGYEVYLTSTENGVGLKALSVALKDKTTVFAGPSGVGKSSILNTMQNEVKMETGEISQKSQRGKHTTRHAQLICYDETSYVVDTPGFSSLYIEDITENELKKFFLEFSEYSNECRFLSCNHINEPDCAVKRAIQNNNIAQSRYDNYCIIYDELKNIRRW